MKCLKKSTGSKYSRQKDRLPQHALPRTTTSSQIQTETNKARPSTACNGST